MLGLPYVLDGKQWRVLVPMPSMTEKKYARPIDALMPNADHFCAKECKRCHCLVNLFLCTLYSNSLQNTFDVIVFLEAVCVIRNREQILRGLK